MGERNGSGGAPSRPDGDPPEQTLAAVLAGQEPVLGWLGGEACRPAAVAARAAAWPEAPAGLAAILGLQRSPRVLVVAGQQPAVGGGPLYTLVKAAQACALAADLRRQGIDAAPLFWCASEDHDLGEAGHCDLLHRDGRIHRFSADLGPGRASLRFRPARSWWGGLLEAAGRGLGPGPGRGFWLDHAPSGDEGMGAWLCRVLGSLLARHGLLTIEGHRLRPLWREPLARLCAGWPTQALAARREEVLASGLDDAFGPLDRPPLFLDRPDGRRPATAEEISSAADDLSPGAALRPVLQQAALPCAAFIAGPGELRYHAFLGPVYAAAGVPRPCLVPRASITLVPGWWSRAAQRRAADPQEAGSEARLAPLAAAIAGLERPGDPPDLARRLAGGRRGLARELDRLRASLQRGERRTAGRPPQGVLDAWVRPRGLPQDRVLSLFQAVWECGPGVADLLVAETALAGPGGQRRIGV